MSQQIGPLPPTKDCAGAFFKMSARTGMWRAPFVGPCRRLVSEGAPCLAALAAPGPRSVLRAPCKSEVPHRWALRSTKVWHTSCNNALIFTPCFHMGRTYAKVVLGTGTSQESTVITTSRHPNSKQAGVCLEKSKILWLKKSPGDGPRDEHSLWRCWARSHCGIKYGTVCSVPRVSRQMQR